MTTREHTTPADCSNSSKESDLFSRSSKKMKRNSTAAFQADQADFPTVTEALAPGNKQEAFKAKSFKDTVTGEGSGSNIKEYSNPSWEENTIEEEFNDDTLPEEEDPTCPVITLSTEEKKRIHSHGRMH